ncbi:MAG: hypothetical protein QOJ84_4581 [Bradyrhizobium sp.]|nr:hypothetical protein [Bradyrhizobium sp.]
MAGSDGDQLVIDYYFSVLRAARGSRWSLRRAPKSHADELSDVYAGTDGVMLQERSQQRQDYRIVELKRWRDRLGKPSP